MLEYICFASRRDSAKILYTHLLWALGHRVGASGTISMHSNFSLPEVLQSAKSNTEEAALLLQVRRGLTRGAKLISEQENELQRRAGKQWLEPAGEVVM